MTGFSRHVPALQPGLVPKYLRSFNRPYERCLFTPKADIPRTGSHVRFVPDSLPPRGSGARPSLSVALLRSVDFSETMRALYSSKDRCAIATNS